MYLGHRCRELTVLTDNKTNRRKLNKKLLQIEAAIASNSFSYEEFFPKSRSLNKFRELEEKQRINSTNQGEFLYSLDTFDYPYFEEFVEQWFKENSPLWRKSHLINIKSIVNKHILPAFNHKKINEVTRVDILNFRITLTKLPGRGTNKTLSNNRINKIMDPLKRIFEEAADRYGFTMPYINIKKLKTKKVDVHPFSLCEVKRIIRAVREDYKNYYTVRFFTGMRTGEIDGLKWKYVDFKRRQIMIRETIVLGGEDYTKNDHSQRDIQMSEPVYKALAAQYLCTEKVSQYVFCNRKGEVLDHNNITKRIWYPLLARLGIEKRRPYQSRHTTATLWLAAGEAPEWIAKQMGHSSTEMLFKVYSRFVPNLTRKDGSAFEKLLYDDNVA